MVQSTQQKALSKKGIIVVKGTSKIIRAKRVNISKQLLLAMSALVHSETIK